jgi:hypothetical protein
MGRKAVDDHALLELEQALRELASASRRRAEAALGEVDAQAERQASHDLRRAAERVATWRRPSHVDARP